MNLAPYGVYAVDMSQTIVFWNPSAERILGHRPDDVIGRTCYEVCRGVPEQDSTPVCIKGCPAIQTARQGTVPPVFHVRMLCVSGSRKPVTVTPLIIPVSENGDSVLLVHLFHENINDSQARVVAEDVLDMLSGTPISPPTPADSIIDTDIAEAHTLTSREIEVLRLVAASLDTEQIAEQLYISSHTVLNHIRNARFKLNAQNKLSAVLSAQRLGLL